MLFLAQNAPETAWRPGLSAPPDPLAAVKGLGPPGGEGKGKGKEGGEGRREGREGEGEGKGGERRRDGKGGKERGERRSTI